VRFKVVRGRLRNWIAKNDNVFRSSDFALGACAFVLTALASGVGEELRARGVQIMLAQAGIGIAVLAVALTALAILVGLLGNEYLRILERGDPDGVHGAFQPYRVTATVGGINGFFSLVAALAWVAPTFLPIPAWVLQSLGLATSTGLAVWSIWGTVLLVRLTAFHGEQRARFIDSILEAKRIAAVQKEHASGGQS